MSKNKRHSDMGPASTNLLLAKSPRDGTTQLAADIRQAIQEGRLRKGERLTPLRQLAEHYEISYGTAIGALEDLQREGLITKRRRAGTFVTFDPERQARNSIRPVDLWLPVKGHVYQGLMEELLHLFQEKGIESRAVVLRNDATAEQISTAMNAWKERLPRALVSRWKYPGVRELMQQGTPAGMRVILILTNPQVLPNGWHSVNPNVATIGRLVVDHLTAKGHRRLGFVTYCRENESPVLHSSLLKAHEWSSMQLSGLKTALWERNLADAALNIYHVPPGFGLGSDALSGPDFEQAVRWLSGRGRPTAIVGDDHRLFAIKRVAKCIGLRVPEDLELLGFGNTPWSEAGGFSSISIGETLMAQEIAKLVAAGDEELGDAARHVTVPPKLIVR